MDEADSWTLKQFLSDFGDTKVVAGEIPYPSKYGKKERRTTLDAFFHNPPDLHHGHDHDQLHASKQASGQDLEPEQEQDPQGNPDLEHLPWIVFDNTVFDAPENVQLRSKVAKRASHWDFAQLCGSSAIGGDGLGKAQLSFGDAGSGTPMHSHSAAYNYLLFGKKHWYLTPPPNVKRREGAGVQHVQAWLQDPDAYAAYKTENVLTECIQRPGELLFIPAGWGHATLNKKPTLAVANEFCSCKGACCGETCSATAALAGDDQSVLARVEQSNAENMAALQAALSEWRSRSLDLQ